MDDNKRKRIRIRPKNAPGAARAKRRISDGSVKIKRTIHDGAAVISASLRLETAIDYKKVISEQMETAALNIKERGGIVGHIKASASVMSTDMFSVTDEDAYIQSAPERVINLNLAAIVFLIDTEEAEKIIKTALDTISELLSQFDI